MIKPEQIPIASMNLYLKSLHDGKSHEACVAAAINAWPEAQKNVLPAFSMEAGRYERPILILPFPQEKNDAFC